MRVTVEEGIENYLQDNYPDFVDDILLADGFEEAFIGVSETYGKKPVAAYDSAKCIDILMKRDNMDCGEDVEYFQSNVTAAYVGEFTPAFIFPFDEEWDCITIEED